MAVEELCAEGADPTVATCYIGHHEEATSRDDLLLIADEQVGRKDEHVRLYVGLAGPLSEVAFSWRIRNEPSSLDQVTTALRSPESILVALRRLFNVFARITNTAERARFPLLADQACKLVNSIEEVRLMAIDQVAYEMRRRDAMKAMDEDPSLSLEDAAERYGLELIDADAID